MAMRVGLVKVLSGSAVAISPDGTKRILHEGDIVFAYEVIRNESGEKLIIEFDGGKRTVLGEHDQIIINTDVLSVMAGQVGVPGQDDDAVTSIQKAILAGSDPTLITEPPARLVWVKIMAIVKLESHSALISRSPLIVGMIRLESAKHHLGLGR